MRGVSMTALRLGGRGCMTCNIIALESADYPRILVGLRNSSNMSNSKQPKRHGYMCFVCKKGIRSNDKFRSTVCVNRGIDGLDRTLGSAQFLYAHGKCLMKLIPLTKYTFPELEK